MKLYNHIAAGFSALEWEMVKHIPEGGNWQNIPDSIPSQRLVQIRKSGGRTTYYGRLVYDKPSFTITTYFNRLGNGCNLHPEQDRVISNREAARLQSFRDSFVFKGTKTSQYKQIGNAVPPLLARMISSLIKPHLESINFIDLFSGAGGISEGFVMNGFELIAANEIERNYFETYKFNHSKYTNPANFILGDITMPEIKQKIIETARGKKIGVIVGGPPCQGFSTAGWRNPNDKRNQLFKDFVEIVKTIQPEFFVMENVLGILTMRKGEAIKEIIESFSEIGYNVNLPIRLNAEDFGVPQKRRRVIIIGSLKKCTISQPQALFSDDNANLPDVVTVKQAIGSLPPISAGDDVVEKDIFIPSNTLYDRLMKEEINFKEFYDQCKTASHTDIGMRERAEKKSDRTWHKNFEAYTEMIVSHANYNGLYFDRGNDGRVNWVATGKSKKGQFRRQWWNEECRKANIRIKAGCYAKIARMLHPTKVHTCQICGRSLSVEYVYPNKNTLELLNKKLNVGIAPYSLSIFEIVDKFGTSSDSIASIKSAFKIGRSSVAKEDLADYIFTHCQTSLSPGVMSNSPDRFDGFHSDGNCCRGESDKGRHKSKLRRYSQDRRVYENWADGNWKMADRLMAEFAKHGLSADHIGPISLGFCHRAKFQPMSKSENSAKNNRMSFHDIQILLADEQNGEQVVSRHSKSIWDKLKNFVSNDVEAVKLSSLMRNNLHQILLVFSIISENGYNDFLRGLLNPEHSFSDYKFEGFNPQTGEYEKVIAKKTTGKNQQNNVDRYVRVAFESLESYKEKENRKQFGWDNEDIDKRIRVLLQHLAAGDNENAHIELNKVFEELSEIAFAKW